MTDQFDTTIVNNIDQVAVTVCDREDCACVFHQIEVAARSLLSVPDEYKNEYCVMFGVDVLFHSPDKEVALKEYHEAKKYVNVFFYTPDSRKL